MWAPGDAAQCDLWFPPKRIPLEDGIAVLLPVMVITAAHSRFTCGEMMLTARPLLWDNEAGIGRRNRLAQGVGEFCGTLSTRMHQLKVHDPESKGIVERRNGDQVDDLGVAGEASGSALLVANGVAMASRVLAVVSLALLITALVLRPPTPSRPLPPLPPPPPQSFAA